MQVNEKYTVPAITKAIDILEFIAQKKQASFAEITETLHLSKSSAYGIINTLISRGCLAHGRKSGTYQLGIYLFSLGSRCLASLDIRDEAMPVLHELVQVLDQTCHLGILDRGEAVYLAKVECSNNLVVRSWVGKRFSLRTTAMGKVMLAWRDEEQCRALLEASSPEGGTERAIRDTPTYLALLQQVRRQGYAIDDQENVPNVRCVAAPVFGIEAEPVAAVSVTAPVICMSDQQLELAAKHVVLAAKKISYRLGCRIYPLPEFKEVKGYNGVSY